ncbi:MAG: ROK family protein [Ruminococcaceae bacterium]|nr:ROK family protein [Oscillospiraceae bacterium]
MYIGIDIGGMSIKAGIVNENGDILAKCAVPTPKNDNKVMLEAMLEAIEKAMAEAGVKKEDIEAIGIGNPGVVDREKGVLVEAVNIGYTDLPVREFLQKHIGPVPVMVENDANCAALGEYYKAENSKNFVFITLGTGVGGGIIINGKLFTGANGAAGELGHIVTHFEGRACSCGRRGCWETYASVTGLIKTTEEHRHEIKGIAPNEEISGRTVFDLARKGDKDAERVRDMWIEEVAIGIVDMVNIFQPDCILIGGAISKEGDTILLPIIDYVNKNAFCSERLTKPKIEISKIGGDAGIIGAALIYKNSL